MLKFQVYLIFIFFIPLIKGQNCPKDQPIYKDGNCILTNCKPNDSIAGGCVIANEIIKTQWLNYRHTLGEKNCRYFSVARSFQNELIFESSYEGNNLLAKKRFFYGYNEGGRELFFDKYEKVENYTKILSIKDGNVQKHFSEISFFNYYNSSDTNKKVISVGASFEIYDYDNGYDGKIFVGSSEKKLRSKIFSDRNYLLELKDRSNSYVFAFNNESYFIIIKFFFNSSDIENGFYELKSVSKYIFGTKMISCYEANLYIVCLYRNKNSKYELSLYDSGTINQISNTYILNEDLIIDSYTLFYKAIYLKNNVGIFGYYKNNNNKNPIIELDNIIVTNSRQYTISPYIQYNNNKARYNLTHYELDNNYNKNDIVKISDTRFSWISTTIQNELIIIIFDLYNDDKNLLIKYYKIPTLQLYNFVVVDNIRGYSLMETLGIGFTVLDYNTNEIFTNFLNFGFSENEDKIIDLNLHPYSRCIYIDFQKETLESISNNIFGFNKIGVKVLSVPSSSSNAAVRFYYNSTESINNTFLQSNHIIDIDTIIRVETWASSHNNKLIYKVLYKEVEYYDNISDYTDYIEFYGENPDNFYTPNYYEGKQEMMEFNLNLKYFISSLAKFCGQNDPETSIGGGGGGGSGSSSPTTTRDCHKNCYECFTKGNDDENKCINCASGMGIKEDEYNPQGSNCYKPKIEGYFFDNSVAFNYTFRLCYPTCKFCSGYGNEMNHSCLVCLDDYYEKEEDLSLDLRNCYKNPQPGYALVGLTGEEKKYLLNVMKLAPIAPNLKILFLHIVMDVIHL